MFRWRRGLWRSVKSTQIALPVWQPMIRTVVGVSLMDGKYGLFSFTDTSFVVYRGVARFSGFKVARLALFF